MSCRPGMRWGILLVNSHSHNSRSRSNSPVITVKAEQSRMTDGRYWATFAILDVSRASFHMLGFGFTVGESEQGARMIRVTWPRRDDWVRGTSVGLSRDF